MFLRYYCCGAHNRHLSQRYGKASPRNNMACLVKFNSVYILYNFHRNLCGKCLKANQKRLLRLLCRADFDNYCSHYGNLTGRSARRIWGRLRRRRCGLVQKAQPFRIPRRLRGRNLNKSIPRTAIAARGLF